MLARRDLPQEYIEWNRRRSAPDGSAWTRRLPRTWWTRPIAASLVGPFAFQVNNDTRRFEYPWACETLAPARGLSVLEMGRETEAHWPLNPRRFSLLSRRFGTSVTLKHGERPELYGFRDFDAGRILAQKDMYYVGRGWPVRVQTLVLAKPR